MVLQLIQQSYKTIIAFHQNLMFHAVKGPGCNTIKKMDAKTNNKSVSAPCQRKQKNLKH
jgi:hypothetical protein